MPSKSGNKQNKYEKDSNYVITLRSDVVSAIHANIFCRLGSDGHAELYYKVERAYTMNGGKSWRYTTKMYPRHAEAEGEVALLAKAWIEQNPQAADGPTTASR